MGHGWPEWKMATYHPKRYSPRDEIQKKITKSEKQRDTEKRNKKCMNTSHSSPTCTPGGQNQHELGTPTRHITSKPHHGGGYYTREVHNMNDEFTEDKQWRSVELDDQDISNSTFMQCGSDEPPLT
jgi:hypothetical protein